MELTHRNLRLGWMPPLAILLFTTGCFHRETWPFPGSDGAREPVDVNVVNVDDATIPVRTMERFIASRVPGIVISRGAIVIRGNATFSSTNAALIMVDGRDMDTVTFLKMSPEDVVRIEVLRGSEAALYGRRGANGVLVITTRYAQR